LITPDLKHTMYNDRKQLSYLEASSVLPWLCTHCKPTPFCFVHFRKQSSRRWVHESLTWRWLKIQIELTVNASNLKKIKALCSVLSLHLLGISSLCGGVQFQANVWTDGKLPWSMQVKEPALPCLTWKKWTRTASHLRGARLDTPLLHLRGHSDKTSQLSWLWNLLGAKKWWTNVRCCS
jgi:hypothetical protein